MRIQTFLKSVGFVAVAMMLLSTRTNRAGELEFRTDINPGLLYFQAYQQMPQFNEADSKHLAESMSADGTKQSFDQRTLDLAKQYDNAFKLLHRARFSRVPCDWGYDLSDGPEALLGGLAPAKRLTQMARLRAMIALQNQRFDTALQDLASVHVLGRNLTTDRVLISVLVQFAIENIIAAVIMENYYRLPSDQLDQLVALLDSSPPRGTIAATIQTEHDGFYLYFLRKTRAMIVECGDDQQRFWSRFEAFWDPIVAPTEANTGTDSSAARIKQATGGIPAGVVQLLEEMPPLYQRASELMTMPYSEFKREIGPFMDQIHASKNPFVQTCFPVLENVRSKEFQAMVRAEMVRAAAAYKRGGTTAMQAVKNPLTGDPFEINRVHFEGVDRGFQLKSTEQIRDYAEVMTFLEKPGKAFYLDGKNAGTAR